MNNSDYQGIERRNQKFHILNMMKDAKIVRLERDNARLERQLEEAYKALHKQQGETNGTS